MKRFNWQIWVGFLISIFAFVSYPFVFARFPVTRDFPWASLLLFGIAIVLLIVGVRRAFAPDRSKKSKVAAAIATTLSVLVLGLFIFTTFVMSRWLPASRGAPQVSQKAPDFTMTDSTGKPVTLAELLSAPINGKTPRGVLLIFYRGYW